MVVSGLGLTREREPWSFWKARVLELDEVRIRDEVKSARYAALDTIVLFLLFFFFLILCRILTRTRTKCVWL